MLFLSKNDIKNCMGLDDCIAAMEKAYRIFYDNAFVMPHRPCIENGSNTLLYMPCFIGECFGTKSLTLFPDNPSKGFPMIDGTVTLNDADNGSVKAIMPAGFLTALRTGANTGVMLKHLAPQNVSTCGIVGAGVQGVFQTAFACKVRNIDTVYVYDPYLKNFEKFCADVLELIDTKPHFVRCDYVTDLVKNSHIVLTATTSDVPVYPDCEDLFRGKTVVAIGSYKPHCRECPDSLVRVSDHIYVDLDFAKEESGELLIPLRNGIIDEDKIVQISDVLYNPALADHKTGETIFIKTVGMALFDVVCGNEIYKKATETGFGTQLEF
ncbi:MAG: ornithine cyclodeaminase family protein [Oscillospiraceae bacterium]|nr:ornithine cyclodeaminase family protein [Oscillospiraceae bacterium]